MASPRERFWDTMESLSPLLFGFAVADTLFGLILVFILATTRLDTTDSSVVLSVLDLVIVVVTLVPLTYVLYRVRQRRIEEY